MGRKLIIGVDIRDLKLAKTGTKTYLEELCKAFREIETEDCRFVFLDTELPVYTGHSKLGKYLEHFCYQFWKQVTLPVKAYLNQCSIVFCTDNFVPLLRLGFQTVPVFHDAFFFENPEHYGKLWLRLYHYTALPAARRSAFVVTPSHYAQQQIHHYTGIPREKLRVIYEGPKTMDVQPEQAIPKAFALQPGNYILHVGSMFKRKNIPALVYAYKQLKDRTQSTVKLVLAGPYNANKDSNDFLAIRQAILDTGLEKDIIITGYLTDTELAGIYANALMYVFPSTNEGFGIPVLEAFKHNLPVLVADNTSLPEIGGDAVITFDPFDVQDISEKMRAVMEDEVLRQTLIKKGQERLINFSWVKSSLQLKALFVAAAQ